MPDYIIAIDPGVSGAAVVIDPTTKEVEDVHTFISVWALQKFVLEWSRVSQNIAIVMEKINPSPIQGVKSAGAMMRNVGHWEAMLIAHFPKAPIHVVTPQEWQRDLGLTSTGPSRKRELKLIAQSRYPDSRVILANCDALLIADYAASNWPVGKLL